MHRGRSTALAHLRSAQKPIGCRRDALAGSLLCAVLLAGCASLQQWQDNGGEVGPNYRRPRAAVADRWIDAGDRDLRSCSGPPACWWSVFDDPALNQLVAAASQQNLTLRVAGLRILEARAQLGIAVSELLPQQQAAVAQYNWNKYSDSAYPFDIFPIKREFDDFSVGMNASWELDFWGRFRRGIEAADASLDAQIDGYDDALVLLQAEVAANYIQMRSLKKRIELTRQNAALQEKTLRLVELRFGKGLVTDLDVQRAKANLAATQALIPVFEIGYRKAQNRLCILMAMPPRDLRPRLGDSATIPQAPAEVVVGIPADLLRRRPDVRRAEREAAVQSARIGMAEAEFFPHIAITGTIGFESEDFFKVFQGGSLAAVIGPGFRWNILNYGRIRNAVRAQDTRFCQAVATYQETVLRANEEAENAVVSYLRDQDRAAALETAAAASSKAADLALLQYEKGLVDYEPVLDTQRDLVRQQDEVAQSRGQVAVDLVALYKALAGGWRVRLARPAAPRPVSAPPLSLLEDDP
ncbi:MAG: efflux transporter outer membrane subunit [Thermoguttaceae bacterium]